MMPTGKGLSIAKLAERLGVSKSTVNKAIDVVKNSSDEDIQAINSGDMTIYEANAKNRKARQGNPIDKEIENQERLPDFSAFLRTFLVEAIVILTEANQQAAVNLLFNHFLETQDEQEEFYQILPENIKEKLLDEKVY
jgi:transcriptional regulator with XRE-family HTH domain